MRESLELLLAAHSLGFDAETQFSLEKRFRFLCETHTKVFRRRSAEQVISENVAGRLGETLWRRAEKRGIASEHDSKRTVSKGSRVAKLRVA